MKLEAPQVLEGFFWRPGHAERLPGRLRISEVSKCQPELLGAFGSLVDELNGDDEVLWTIHGLVEGGAVTLITASTSTATLALARSWGPMCM